MTLIEKVKLNLRLSIDVFDEGELQDIINACLIDLGLTDIDVIDTEDSMIVRAVVVYAKAHFGESDQFERYKKIYDEMKATMAMSSKYTKWGA